MKLYTDDPKIEFDPPFKQIENTLLNCISNIIKSAEGLPRVEVELFPFPEYKKFLLRSIRPDEQLVELFTNRVLKVFEANKIGPQKYFC
jgi:dynein heavy chain